MSELSHVTPRVRALVKLDRLQRRWASGYGPCSALAALHVTRARVLAGATPRECDAALAITDGERRRERRW